MNRRLVIVIASAVLLAGCSGVPHSSKPSAIATVSPGAPQGGQVPAPESGASPRAVLQAFLSANDAPLPATNGIIANYLGGSAKAQWSPSTVTIIDNENVGTPDKTNKIEVTGTEVGTIDKTGVYTPALSGDGSGSGGLPFTATFGLQLVKGGTTNGQTSGDQYRISSITPNGLLINVGQFSSFRPYPLYFFDSTEHHLVPDPRWFPQSEDPADVISALLNDLVSGPRPALQADVTTEFPAQTVPASVSATSVRNGPDAGLTRIEIPQSSQLGSDNLNLLAAQIAQTLAQVSGVAEIQITDNGKPVRIKSVDGTTFTAAEVAPPYLVSSAPPGLYYVRDGGVIDGRTAAAVGRNAYGLESAAVAERGSKLLVAGTRADGTALDIGTLDNGGQMTAVKLPAVPGGAQLSRPDWAPGLSEVWVADRTKLFAVQSTGQVRVVNLIQPSGLATARIAAVRLSPEGSRVALVLTNADGSSQIWIGSIFRPSNKQVRVDNLTPISPQGVDVADLAWNDQLKLFAIGHNSRTGVPSVYEVQVDGALWNADGLANLPASPVTIAAAAGNVAAVGFGRDDKVWTQTGLSWFSLPGSGSAPIYSN